MAEIWKPQTLEVYKSWVSAIEDVSEELNDWELNFIESISDKLDRRSNLTERQAEVLERIYAEKTK